MPRNRAHLEQLASSPRYMTSLGPRLPDGRCRSSMDGSVWLYGAVPLAQVLDAKSAPDQLTAMDPLFNVLNEVSTLSGVNTTRRYVAKGAYRQVHLLLVNLPEYFHTDWANGQADYLNRAYGEQVIDRRLLLIGVRLKDVWGGGGTVREIVESTAAFISDRQVPMGDFDADFKKVKAAFARSGVRPPTARDVKLADAYWNAGRTPVTGTLAHLEHLHVFSAAAGMTQAKELGVTECEAMEDIPTQSALTYAAIADFDFDFDQPDSPRASWASYLLDRNALAVSVRGFLEPAKVTSKELRRQRKRFVKDIAERQRANKMSLAEQDEQLQLLEQVEAHYGTGQPSPTITDTSILVAFSGIEDIDQINADSTAVELEPMTLTQLGAMAETWLCSSVRANPRRHDLPIQVLAASGLNNLSFVGDRDGALLGFTERDRQPAYISPRAASVGDALPILVGMGSTGSGKTLNMLNLCQQWTRGGIPGVFVDPKLGSDHSGVFDRIGGQVIRLDEVSTADGIFDAIRLLPGDQGIMLAVSNLMAINPWGVDREAMEQPLIDALKYGVEHGATCIGQALQIAEDQIGDRLPTGLASKVLSTRRATPTMAALIGLDPRGESLSVAKGATLIMVGDSSLDLPHEGDSATSLPQRCAVALVRMMVFGASTALTRHGGGYVLLDEAWTFLQNPAEVVRLGRIARSQQVLPCLFTQLPDDIVKNKLSAFISRFLIGPLVGDREQAAAACTAARIDPDRYEERLIADEYQAGTSHSQRTPNWTSMKALRDPDTREVLRGSIWLYKDLDGSVIPVETWLPGEFLDLASTNPIDIERRRQRADQQEALHV